MVLGATALGLVWSGHDVTWMLPARTAALWMLEPAGVLLTAAAGVMAVARSVGRWLGATAIAVTIVLVVLAGS